VIQARSNQASTSVVVADAPSYSTAARARSIWYWRCSGMSQVIDRTNKWMSSRTRVRIIVSF